MRARPDTIEFRNAQAFGRGWTQLELCEIDRIRTACRECLQIELIAGDSDEGDPWCIVCSRGGERIILHIARIDRSYVIAWPCRSKLQRTTSITSAADLALRGLDRELRGRPRTGCAA
jgi:hypothetical protein